MALPRRWIKLGRLFMVAWLAFFIYPVAAFLTDRFSTDTRTYGLLLLLALGLIWAWFWTRIIAGPDRRYMVAAILAATLILTLFTLRTPPQYGSLFLYAVIMAGAACPWGRGVAAVVILSVLAAVIELARGESATTSTGQLLNELLVGFAAVAGRLLVEANQQLSQAREQIARLAVGEERLRFARDLHDLLGHSLSVIALKSELAGRLIKSTPGLAAHEVDDIESVARDALREVREAVAGYRQPSLKAELAGAREALTAAARRMSAQGHPALSRSARASRHCERVIRVLIAEDQSMVRGALKALLAMEGDIEIVAETDRADQVLPLASQTKPDVALLEIEMPGGDGITAAGQLRKELPSCKTLILTTFGRPGFLRRAMESGASGFMLKDAPAHELALAIRRTMAGERVIDPGLAASALSAGVSPLSEREREVLVAGQGGASIAEIAKSLFLSEGTVRNYLSSAIQKLEVSNRTEAARVAEEHGWL